MLIYKQLGPSAEEEFANTWGIGYALDNVSEWQVREWVPPPPLFWRRL
jgi:hypothetical protein